MPRAFARSRCLPPKKPLLNALAGARPGALSSIGRRRQPPCLFIDVRKLRLDLSSHRCSRALRGRAHFCDFCRRLFQRARPGTARTSQTTGIRSLGRLPPRSKVAFPSRGSRRRYAGSGVEHTEARHSRWGLLTTETLPQPRSLQTPRVADTALHPVWRDAGRERCRRHCPH